MELKRLIVNTKLLLDDIIDVNKASFHEVRADDAEVTNLWKEYNRLRNLLQHSYPEIFNSLPEHTVPEPNIVKEESFHFMGTLVFSPEHFSPLRMEVEQILTTLNEMKKKDKNFNTPKKSRKYRA